MLSPFTPQLHTAAHVHESFSHFSLSFYPLTPAHRKKIFFYQIFNFINKWEKMNIYHDEQLKWPYPFNSRFYLVMFLTKKKRDGTYLIITTTH